jgi:hypothetical protein
LMFSENVPLADDLCLVAAEAVLNEAPQTTFRQTPEYRPAADS